MRRALFPILCVFLTLGASATPLAPSIDVSDSTTGATTPSSPATTGNRAQATEDFSLPQAVGKPHICAKDIVSSRLPNPIGITTVRFIITADGNVENVKVTKSSGVEFLDDAAVNCAAEWQYKPATSNGKQVAVPWSAEVNWLQR